MQASIASTSSGQLTILLSAEVRIMWAPLKACQGLQLTCFARKALCSLGSSLFMNSPS